MGAIANFLDVSVIYYCLFEYNISAHENEPVLVWQLQLNSYFHSGATPSTKTAARSAAKSLGNSAWTPLSEGLGLLASCSLQARCEAE